MTNKTNNKREAQIRRMKDGTIEIKGATIRGEMTNKTNNNWEEIEKRFERAFRLMRALDKAYWSKGYPKLENTVKEKIKETLISTINKIGLEEKTWGGYDGEEIVDDKRAYGYNEAVADLEAKKQHLIREITK